ncbi:hypothetical protein [Pseudodesulfovibrio karagichevae]|uniref:Uncharacterized protein n=1 Tax=Pseudodesulfovibrio karagichevae TaxID=3239305 RepID=A0ABV4K0P2_9BACT
MLSVPWRPRGLSWIFLLLALVAAGGAASVCWAGGPGTAAAGKDNAPAFTMAFPADFTVYDDPKALAQESYFPLDDGSVLLGGCYSGPDYAGTNFGSACVVVSVSPAEEDGDDCARFDGDSLCGAEQGVRDAAVNGLPFKRGDMSDAAMGHRLEARDYWTVRGGQRYDIRLFLSYTDIGMYGPGEKREFSREDCWARLNAVLNTFSFRR